MVSIPEEVTDALKAAEVAFDFSCDWQMATHLVVLYDTLTRSNSGEKLYIAEETWVCVRNGIEALRSTQRLRPLLMRGDMCVPNWNIDIMLYVVSCLILTTCMPDHANELQHYRDMCLLHDKDVDLYENSHIPFTGRMNPLELNTPQMHTCVLVLTGNMSSCIDWQSAPSWSTYQLMEVRMATFVASSLISCTSGVYPDSTNFAACAGFAMLATATAAARARRCTAVRCTKVLWQDLTFSESINRCPSNHIVNDRLIEQAAHLGSHLAQLFTEYSGEEQSMCLDRALIIDYTRSTDSEFASYCVNGGRAAIGTYTAFSALWPTETLEALSGQSHMDTFCIKNDIQCLKIANNYFSSLMHMDSKRRTGVTSSWMTEAVLLEDDWVKRCPLLFSRRSHPPIIVQLGCSLGWAVVYWDECGTCRAQTAMLMADRIQQASDLSELLICVIFWVQQRLLLENKKDGIRQENGNMASIFEALV